MCKECLAGNGPQPSPRLQWMLTLYRLRCAGYPFMAEDLTLEDWLDLGDLAGYLDPQRAGAIAPRGAPS